MLMLVPSGTLWQVVVLAVVWVRQSPRVGCERCWVGCETTMLVQNGMLWQEVVVMAVVLLVPLSGVV